MRRRAGPRGWGFGNGEF